MIKRIYKDGFTLAEVLITLGIIGIVAAMTLPGLINKYEKNVTVNVLKKKYTNFNEALNMLKADKDVTQIFSIGNCEDVHQAILPYLGILSSCNLPPSNCWNDTSAPTDISGNKLFTDPNDGSRGYMLSDGSILVLRCWGAGLGFTIDVNGTKKPNRDGRDIFRFYLLSREACFNNGDCAGSQLTTQKDGVLYAGSYGPNYITFSTLSRDELLQDWCNITNSLGCTDLIVIDGWEIADDYPW